MYLAVSMVAQRFVCFIDHHALDLLGRAGVSGQIINHDLRREEEDPLGSPNLLSLLCCCATYEAVGAEFEKGGRWVLCIRFYVIFFFLPVSSAMCACGIPITL